MELESLVKYEHNCSAKLYIYPLQVAFDLHLDAHLNDSGTLLSADSVTKAAMFPGFSSNPGAHTEHFNNQNITELRQALINL